MKTKQFIIFTLVALVLTSCGMGSFSTQKYTDFKKKKMLMEILTISCGSSHHQSVKAFIDFSLEQGLEDLLITYLEHRDQEINITMMQLVNVMSAAS